MLSINTMIGRRVKVAREILAYTQEDMARELGLGIRRYRKIEAGKRPIEAADLAVIARLTGRELAFFIEGRCVAVR